MHCVDKSPLFQTMMNLTSFLTRKTNSLTRKFVAIVMVICEEKKQGVLEIKRNKRINRRTINMGDRFGSTDENDISALEKKSKNENTTKTTKTCVSIQSTGRADYRF